MGVIKVLKDIAGNIFYPVSKSEIIYRPDNSSVEDALVALENSEQNVQSDWNQTNSTADDYIKNKPTIPSAYTHPNHTGAVTSIGDGVTTITDKAITVAKIEDMPACSIIGNDNTGLFAPEYITAGADTVLRRAGANNLVFGSLVTNNLGNDIVTNTKLANMAANTVKGRVTASTGDPEDITMTQLRTMLGAAYNSSTAYQIQKDGTDGAGIINFKTS